MQEIQDTDEKIRTPIQDLVSSTQQNSTVGPLVGSIIIIALIIVGGLYFFGSLIQAQKNQIEVEQTLEEQNEAREVEQTVIQSDSDDVTAIEADLQATNIDQLDQNLTSEIEKEF